MFAYFRKAAFTAGKSGRLYFPSKSCARYPRQMVVGLLARSEQTLHFLGTEETGKHTATLFILARVASFDLYTGVIHLLLGHEQSLIPRANSIISIRSCDMTVLRPEEKLWKTSTCSRDVIS